MMILSSDKATDFRKAPLEGTIVSELGGAPSAAPVVGGADRTGLADAARREQHSGPSAALIGSRIMAERGGAAPFCFVDALIGLRVSPPRHGSPPQTTSASVNTAPGRVTFI
jgi:hypothetical protein